MELRGRRILWGGVKVAMVCLLGIVWASGQTAPVAKPTTTAARAHTTAARTGSAAHGEQTAEQVFRKVDVLKGISVDEFMDTMGFFAASLSWNCTDCHGENAVDNWANFADETPRKITARKMILMVANINKENFGGVRNVTCFTCHRGDARPKITPSLVLQYSTPFEDPNEVEARANAPGQPTADQVFDKYFEALGGTQHLAGFTSIVAKGLYSGYDSDNQKVPVDIYAKAPAQMATVVHAGLGDSIRVFSGTNAWIASPDRALPLLPLTGGDVLAAKIDATLVFGTGIKQLFPQWRVAEATIDDKDVRMVEGVAPGQLPLKLYFDEDTGLLVRVLHLTNTVIGFNPTQVDFADYREIPGAGVKVPFHRVTTWTDNQTTVDLSDVQANVPIEASRFAQPAPAPPGHVRQ
jgi:photosynthetic reaction center cytochrome c subunit